MPNETMGRTIAVAVGVCVVCSVLVSTASVALKERQEEMKTADKKKNILSAAGFDLNEVSDLQGAFDAQIDVDVIDVTTGEIVDMDPATLDERRAAKDPKQRVEIPADVDLAGLKARSPYQSVYRTKPGSDDPRLILPVHGKGLWSTMYGFVALDANDLNSIKSFAFYEHGETPGLGGEVDNPRWKKSWVGKKAFDQSGQPVIDVVKGTAPPDAISKVDGLSGATLTARGVENLVLFWLGENGYGPFLAKLRQQSQTGGNDG